MRGLPQQTTSGISIHVPRVEDDIYLSIIRALISYFNPRPPCGGRHLHSDAYEYCVEFQSTSPVWRTTSDRRKWRRRHLFQSTSPVWRTTPAENTLYCGCLFQSTSPVWRKTGGHLHQAPQKAYFNPRPPCGGRQNPSCKQAGITDHFNPRPPCGGRQCRLLCS